MMCSKDLGMEFGMEKCTNKNEQKTTNGSRKRQMTKRIKLRNQEKIRKLREMKTYKYLGIMEADSIKHAGMEEKKGKKHLRRTKNFLESNNKTEISPKG